MNLEPNAIYYLWIYFIHVFCVFLIESASYLFSLKKIDHAKSCGKSGGALNIFIQIYTKIITQGCIVRIFNNLTK